MLGDTDYSDVTYTGTPDTSEGSSVLSMDYYRNKAREFQQVLNALDAGMSSAEQLIAADISPELTSDLTAMLNEADAKRFLLRATAEAINAGAAVINAAGGRFPELSIPTGLGFLPALPVAAIAAIATAATLIAWGVSWLDGLNERLRNEQLLGAIDDPAKRSALASSLAQTAAAASAAKSSPLGDLAGIVKWGALAFGAWLVYRAFIERKG